MASTGNGHIVALSLVGLMGGVFGIRPLLVGGVEVGGDIYVELFTPIGVIAFSRHSKRDAIGYRKRKLTVVEIMQSQMLTVLVDSRASPKWMLGVADFMPTVCAHAIRGFKLEKLLLIPKCTCSYVNINLVLLLGKLGSNFFGDEVINLIYVPTKGSVIADSFGSSSGSNSINGFFEVLPGHFPDVDVNLTRGANDKRAIDGAVAGTEAMDQKSYGAFYVTKMSLILPIPSRPTSAVRDLSDVLLGSNELEDVHNGVFLLGVLSKHPTKSSDSKEGNVCDGIKVPSPFSSGEGKVYVSLGRGRPNC